MGNGKWEMGNGKWEMGNGKWEMGNGKNIIHELNTPLTTILLKVQLIQKNLESSLLDISDVLKSVERQKKVINTFRVN